jgi:quercetin dioxygenase-like cupin family protein
MDVQHEPMTSLPGFEPAAGVRMRPLFGERAMLNWIEMEPGAVVPQHSHPHEQLGVILRGEITLTIAGVEHVMRPDDGYAIPGGVEHGGVAGPDGCLLVDVFAPVREDYRDALASS